MIGISSQWKLALAVVALLSSLGSAATQDATRNDVVRPAQRLSTICADRHTQLLTLIEGLGERLTLAGDVLFKAQLAIMHARDVCAGGSESEALSLYDRAALELVLRVSSLR